MVHRAGDVDRVRAAELLRAGRSELAGGRVQRAHDLWRQAAALHPHNEAVWLALLDVVESREDRRVCLENIITINPRNEQAQRQLRALNLFQYTITETETAEEEPPRRHPLRRLALFVLQVLLTIAGLVLLVVLAMAIGVLLSSI